MAVDYVDVLQANGRSYMSDYGMGHAQGSQRGAPQMTIGCTLSAWSDRYGQATMESHDGWATFLPIGTVVYAVKGHSPLCQLMATLNSQWELFTSTEAGCPSPPPLASHPPKT